jgi:hypothetical protein
MFHSIFVDIWIALQTFIGSALRITLSIISVFWQSQRFGAIIFKDFCSFALVPFVSNGAIMFNFVV